MKYILIAIMVTIFCFGQDSKSDKLDKLKKFDLKKGLELGNLVPNKQELDPFYKPLNNQEIDEIQKKAEAFEPSPVDNDDIVILETTLGTLKIRLNPKVAPNHCLNFKKLANSGFYDGTSFHRVIPGFMIQGGDILSRDGNPDNDGTGSPGWTVNAEFSKVKHRRGILSMARSSNPNAAGSQFFICVEDATPLDGQYTAFGEVIENIEVIDRIVNTATGYDQVKAYFKNSIPKGENSDNWIALKDPKTGKAIYAPIPGDETKSSYTWKMQNELKSTKPVMPVRMKSVRVVNSK